MSPNATLERRLANHRAGHSAGPAGIHLEPQGEAPAVRLAAALGGEVVETSRGRYIRCDLPPTTVPLDRGRLALLPGMPPASVPLVCLDTETTGLATAAGTIAFLVGIGWWEGATFRRVQLVVPDQPDEPAMLGALADLVPADAWLVTYNGHGFDWPLLEARFRMDRRAAPSRAGHLDLLPFVRRVFRHRMTDARLRTVERELLDLHRRGDVEGAEIPGRYLAFLRGGTAGPLVDVARHNALDVWSLATLLAHIDRTVADPDLRRSAHRGDLAAVARLFRRERRHAEALACLDAALDADRAWDATARTRGVEDPHLTPDPRRIRDGIAAERARTLRRLGRHAEALAAWRELATASRPLAALAIVEIAKALEHAWTDPIAALAIVERGRVVAERGRAMGRPMPIFEADLARRRRRLAARIARHLSAGVPASARKLRDPPLHGLPRGNPGESGTLEDEGRCGGREAQVELCPEPAADEPRLDAGGEERGEEDVAGSGRVDDRRWPDTRPAAHPRRTSGTATQRNAAVRALGEDERRARMQQLAERRERDVRVEVVAAHAHDVRALDDRSAAWSPVADALARRHLAEESLPAGRDERASGDGGGPTVPELVRDSREEPARGVRPGSRDGLVGDAVGG
ncbi:MAG: ribonuclease H-like domain-containing protein [Chloroflexi bacterium]|nr:ribonuclease H-like domain-containing protein [Chloroflexota bacterium]